MPSTEDRIVSMQFDNRSFEANIQQTISSLEALKKNLNFSGSEKGLDSLAKSVNGFDMSTIGSSVDAIAAKFTALGVIGVSALASITNKAVEAGLSLAKSLSIGPLVAGFQEYETNIQSVQTILANTKSQGTNLQDVTAALDELNTYSDQTIYNFGEMAKNVATFTAAGVDLDTAVSSIKGIANIAALSGAGAEKAAMAMYQLSQAIATGTVRLIDWNSVQNAGIGGEVFQQVLFEAGKAVGTIANLPVNETFAGWKKSVEGFRNSLGKAQDVEDPAVKLANSMAEAAKVVSDAEKDIIDTTEKSGQRVIDAKQRVADSITNGAEDIAKAEERQRRTIEDSAKAISNSFQNVINARKRLDDALKPASTDELTAAEDRLTSAKLDQLDLANATEKANIAQNQGLYRETQARIKLAAAMKSGNPADQSAAYYDLQQAQFAVADNVDAITRAEIRQRSVARDVTAAQESLTAIQNKGTDSDLKVASAKDNLLSAEERYARDIEDSATRQKEAADSLASAKENSARRQSDAIKNLAAVEEDRVSAIERVQERLGIAHEKSAKIISDAADTNSTAWLTSKVLTTALSALTGDMTKADLLAMKFTDDQANYLLAVGKLAKESATEVKTITQLFGVVKEAIGSGWSASFRSLFGNIEQAKTLYKDWGKKIGDVVEKSSEARNKILGDWAALGGRQRLIEAITNLFRDFGLVMKPIKEAFRDIFPRKTGAELNALTEKFLQFTKRIAITNETAAKIKTIFKGVFSAFSIVGNVVKNVTRLFWSLTSIIGGAAGGILIGVITKIANGLIALNGKLVKGNGLDNFFDKIINKGNRFKEILFTAMMAFKSAFGGKTFDVAAGGLATVNSIAVKMGALFSKIGPVLSSVKDSVVNGFGALVDFLAPLKQVFPLIGNAIMFAGSALVDFATSAAGFVADAGSGFLGILKGIWNALSNLGSVVGGIVSSAFGKIKNILFGTSESATKLSKAIGVKGSGEGVTGAAENAGGIGEKLIGIWDGVKRTFDKVKDGLVSAGNAIKDAFSSLWEAVQATFDQVSWGKVAAVGGGLLFANLLGTIKQFLNGGLAGLFLGGDLVKSIQRIFHGLTDVLSSLQQAIKAQAIMNIAKALALLTVSIVVLSMIDGDKLLKSMIVVGVGLGLFMSAMYSLEQMANDTNGPKTAGSVVALSVAIGVLAGAMVLLSLSLVAMSFLNPIELAAGLFAMDRMLKMIIESMNALAKVDMKTVLKASIGLWAISRAIRGMAKAVVMMAEIDFWKMIQGLGGLIVVVKTLIFMIDNLPKGSDDKIKGMFVLGVALRLIAGAVENLGSMDLGKMIQGLIGLAAILEMMAFTFILLDKVDLKGIAESLIAFGISIVLLSGALIGIAIAIAIISLLSWESLLKAIGSLVILLPLLAIAMAVMNGNQMGALAMILAAGAIVILAIALEKIGNLSWGDIFKGLGAAALFLGGLVAAALLIEPALPALFALGVALSLIGLAVYLFGSGVNNLAEGVAIMSKAGTKGIQVFKDLLKMAITAIPEFVAALANSFIELATGILKAAPAIISAAIKVLTLLFDAILTLLPKIVEVGGKLFDALLTFILKKAPDLIQAGIALILNLLQGIRDNIPEVVKTVVEIIVAMQKALTDHIEVLVDSGIELLNKLLEGFTKGFEAIKDAALAFATTLIQAIIDIIRTEGELVKGIIVALVDVYVGLTQTIAEQAIRIVEVLISALVAGIKAFSQGFVAVVKAIAQGIIDGVTTVTSEFARVVVAIFGAILGAEQEIIDGTGQFVLSFLSAITTAINTYGPEFASAGGELVAAILKNAVTSPLDAGKALLNGLTGWFSDDKKPKEIGATVGANVATGLVKGLDKNAPKVAAAGGRMGEAAINGANTTLKVNSPSRVFMQIGGYLAAGLALGMDNDSSAQTSGAALGDRVTTAMQNTLGNMADAFTGIAEINPTIAPVLDLSSVEQQAGRLNDILSAQTLDASISAGQASSLSLATTTQLASATQSKSGVRNITFEQIINAPTALSNADIYRQTRSQIQLAKEELLV